MLLYINTVVSIKPYIKNLFFSTFCVLRETRGYRYMEICSRIQGRYLATSTKTVNFVRSHNGSMPLTDRETTPRNR